MTKKTRTILFFTLVFLFLIITPIIIFYSDGYRFDFEKGIIIETGGLYIKTYPSKANVSLNEKKEYLTSNLSKDVFIQNLLPEKHKITIKKEGYQDWTKDIEIEERKVSEIDIVLVKNNIKKELLDSNIKNLYNEENLILENEDSFYYFDLKNQEKDLIVENIEWDWFKIIGNRFLGKKENKYYLIDNQEKTFSDIGQENFKIDKKNNFYYEIDKRIYKNNEIIAQNVDLYEIDSITPYFFIENYLYRNDQKITNKEFIFDEKKEYQFYFIKDKIFLNENDEILYILDKDNFKKILNLNNYFEYSEWNNKIIFNTGNEIWVYFIEDNYYPTFSPKNTLKFLTRFSTPIKDIDFLNDKYYLFIQNNNLILSEFDSRDKIISYTLFENLVNPKMFYFNKNIYLLDDTNLYKIEKFIQ